MSVDIPAAPVDFIRKIVTEDIKSNKHDGRLRTRFPPEPNGYLHIGHAKSICLNFGVAEEFGGLCHLRYDDTNPAKESQEYVDAIQRDVHWLGFSWGENLFFTSDYFERLRDFAEALIRAGKAYVDSLNAEEIREHRGTLTQPGRESPYRNRSVEENLDLFQQMEAGAFEDGTHVVRAKIDMASPNMNLRDPTLYRIRRVIHHRSADRWCIYPMYDYSHPLADAIEGITHSLCTLEFEDHRPLYDWVLDNLPPFLTRPQQIEFARLSLEYTVMSKRKLNELVIGGYVSGWDDPRMPTIAGLRRRGYTPESIREFCNRIGVAKADNRVEMAQLENCVREDLDAKTPRVLAVLRPLRVVIDNYPEGQVEALSAPYHPKEGNMGSRLLPMPREIYIDREDFSETPPKGYKRLVPGGEVRLRHAYVIRCQEVVKDSHGEVVALRCTYDPATLGANPEGRKVQGVIHWVSADHALTAEVRLYDRLFSQPDPEDERDGADWKSKINPDSVVVLRDCRVEPSLAEAVPESRYQFEREGYFVVDWVDSAPGRLVFNRTVTLRDSWGKTRGK